MANRKLLAEIDRTLKKVTEGVEDFEDIYQKLHASTSINQKEKFEQDLKKEIKKLQRLRDNIKGWISSADIKDKSNLIESRKIIETQMERFKAVEREMKTKAYSKEGLNAAAKIDPKEKEKLDLSNWISSVVDKLNTQIDAFEAQVESIQAVSKKGKKGAADAERLKALESRISKHKDHMSKLELILRLVENGVLQPDQVNPLRESIEYYADNNEDEDFVDDDYVYDDLNLEEEGMIFNPSEENIDKSLESAPNDSKQQRKASKDTSEPLSETVPALSIRKTSSSSINSKEAPSKNIAPSSSSSVTSPTSKVNVLPSKSAVPSTTITASVTSSSATATVGMTSSAAASNDLKEDVVSVAPSANPSSNSSTSMVWNKLPASVVSAPEPKTSIGKRSDSSVSVPLSKTSNNSSAKDLFPSASDSKGESINRKENNSSAAPTITSYLFSKQPSEYNSANCIVSSSDISPKTLSTDLSIHPSMKELSDFLESLKDGHVQAEEDISSLIESSFQNIPDSLDKDRVGQNSPYSPKIPFNTNSHFPTTPLPIFDNPVLYEKFELDTLFFIFYFQQRTYQQYLAARELKRQSWRFHKKYLAWFQRHEEPKTITEEYEQGTYIYFDYEGAWCQRKKADFTFEYRYLEDADLS